MTRKITEGPPRPTEKEQVKAFSAVQIREMPTRINLVLDFPRWAREAVRHWDDVLQESDAEFVDCAGLWVSKRWLQEVERSNARPGVSPLGALLFIELYARGYFGGDQGREAPSKSLHDYASWRYSYMQYKDLISRVDAIYEAQYQALLRQPERIRLRRISAQMLEDVFTAQGVSQGDATLAIAGSFVSRKALIEKSRLIHRYSWQGENEQEYECCRFVRIINYLEV